MLSVLGPVIADQHMGGAAAWAGLLAAKSAGMVAGSLLVARIRPRFPVRTAVLATFGSLPPVFLFAAAAPVWLVGALMLVNGVTVDIFEVLFDTALQTHVPGEALSRIASYDAASAYTLGPLGTMLAAPLSEAIGASGSLYGAGVLMTLAAITTFASRSVRQLPAEVTASAAPARASLKKPHRDSRQVPVFQAFRRGDSQLMRGGTASDTSLMSTTWTLSGVSGVTAEVARWACDRRLRRWPQPETCLLNALIVAKIRSFVRLTGWILA